MIIKKPSKSRDNQNGPNVFFYKNQFFYQITDPYKQDVAISESSKKHDNIQVKTKESLKGCKAESNTLNADAELFISKKPLSNDSEGIKALVNDAGKSCPISLSSNPIDRLEEESIFQYS